jgi:hypothetical protein
METSNTIIVDNSYRNFIQSIKSANTKIDYARGLKYFLKFMKDKKSINEKESTSNRITEQETTINQVF